MGTGRTDGRTGRTDRTDGQDGRTGRTGRTDSGPERQCKIRSQNTIPYIGTEILNVHCFCTMEMFLFSKSIIAVANSVKNSRRIFLDRSQGLKCTKKTKNFSSPRSLYFPKTQKTQNFSSPRSLYFPKTRKKLKNSLVPEAYISPKLEKNS